MFQNQPGSCESLLSCVVADGMINDRHSPNMGLLRSSPKSDSAVLLTTFVLTVVFDLVVAIEIGLVLACILFLKRMSDVAGIKSWERDKTTKAVILRMRSVPAMDASALLKLQEVHKTCVRNGVVLILSHITKQSQT